jgi:WD40 repeat protein
MINARRYECFCVDPRERWLFAGNTSGQISVVDVDSFTIVREYQAHIGIIRAVAAHPSLPYLAAFGNDRCVSLWKRGDDGSLSPISYTSVRDLQCSNDDGYVAPILSHTVALGFHDTEPRLVTRSGNGGVLEMEFDDCGCVQPLWCVRLHGNWDLQMTRYVRGSDLILSTGRDGCLVLNDRGQELRRWKFGDTVAHWAEPLEGSTYLVASDAGRVLRLDINSDAEPVMGDRFARDDMEYVTYSKVSGRAFATSFDRNVYEVDPVTCQAKGVVYSPGYKCIWAKELECSPGTLLVQSRNGGLYKADADTGRTLAMIKETPDALWSGVNLPGGDFLIAGEGAQLTRLRYASVDPIARKPRFDIERIPTDMPADTYTKRMVLQPSTGKLVLGRTDGDIWVGADHSFARLTNLGSAVRDLAVAPKGNDLFAVTEDGRALKLDLATGAVQLTFESEGEFFPRAIWTLAYNPVRNLLAFAEFGGDLHIVSGADFSPYKVFECERPKRMRWVDPDLLLFGSSGAVHRYALGGKPEPLVTMMQNTVEDFIWDNRRQYLLVICYQCTIALCDFDTGEKLDLVRDQMDYSKGLAWLDASIDPRLYPWDFITWGRSGAAHHFRIHDERLMALGPVGAPSLA